MRRFVHHWLAVVIVSLLAIACLPRERLNSTCTWRGDSTFAVEMQNTAHRAHLTLDVRLAEELGIRYGDSFKSVVPIAETGVRRQRCTDSTLAIVEHRHSVGTAQIRAVTGTRELWIDMLSIFAPMTILFALAVDRIARRVGRSWEPDERWPLALSLIALAPIVAGIGAVGAHLWSWGVDSFRLWDSHLSYRAVRLPIGRHAIASWTVGLVIYAAIVAYRWPSLARGGLPGTPQSARGARATARFGAPL